MGRALAVSKLEDIKGAVNTLEKNFKKESDMISQQAASMLQKHQPVTLENNIAQALSMRADEVIGQFPKINALEKELEIQDSDPELVRIQQTM